MSSGIRLPVRFGSSRLSRVPRSEKRASDIYLERTGLRRIDWVRFIVSDDSVRAEVIGIGFQLPSTCPISLSLASELVGSGVPYVVRQSAKAE